MAEMLSTFLAKVLFCLFIAAGVLFYWIKAVVAKSGYETHLLWGHWDDLKNMHTLVRNHKKYNPKRDGYRRLLLAFYLATLGFVGCLILLTILNHR